MHLQIRLLNGEILNQPMSLGELDSNSARLGALEIVLEPAVLAGTRPRVKRIIPKASVLDYFEISDDRWAELEAEKKARTEAQKQAAVQQQRDAKRAEARKKIEDWNKQPVWKRLGRKCPYSLPPAKVEAPAVELAPATAPEATGKAEV